MADRDGDDQAGTAAAEGPAHVIDVPDWVLRRNNKKVAEAGLENSGVASLDYALQCLSLSSYADVDILDIGCGARFAVTFVNRSLPLKSYTGIELLPQLVDYLKQEIETRDDRFRFALWDVHNARYNKGGTPMAAFERLPVADDFDIVWAWSVFTHLAPHDAADLLRLARVHVRPTGRLFFSAFIDPAVDGFEDRDPINTLTYAYYAPTKMREMIAATGWQIDAFYPPNSEAWVQSVFVCSPHH